MTLNRIDKNMISGLPEDLNNLTQQLAHITTLITGYEDLVVNGDWSNAIQQAVNDAVENQEIHFPTGEYNFSNVTVNKPIKITGKGTLKKNNQANKLFIVNFISPYTNIWNTFEITDVSVDGNQQNSVEIEDIIVSNVGRLKVNNVKFKNPSKSSLSTTTNIDTIEVSQNKFNDGMYFSGNTSSTATFHFINTSDAKLTVMDNIFETSIVYDGGNGTQAGVIKASPIAIYSENAKKAVIKNNKSINAGHIDLYSLNHKAIVTGNEFTNCHHPAVKVQESRDCLIEKNIIENSLCKWAYSITVQGYARASSYGSLESEQYYGVITNNIIDGSKNGGILVNGAPYSTAINQRDASITDDIIVYGYNITNNEIRNTKQNAIRVGFAGECKISDNYVKTYGLDATASNLNRAGIAIQKPKGLIDIISNHILGDGVNGKFGIVHDNTGLSSIVPSSKIRLKDNFIKGNTIYQIYAQYIEKIEISKNTISDDIAVLIKVDQSTETFIQENTGFDLSDANKMQISNIQYLQTDYRKPSKHVSYGSSAPSTGTYKKGDIVYTTIPIAGGYLGWVCTVAGTPGTWKGFGLIEA